MHKAAAGFALSVAYFAAPRAKSVCVWQCERVRVSVVVVVAAGWQISKQMHIMFRIREREGGGVQLMRSAKGKFFELHVKTLQLCLSHFSALIAAYS